MSDKEVASRPGVEFVHEVKYAWLIRFVLSNAQTVVIEMGVGYFRFHTADEQPYEISSPYSEADLPDIHYAFFWDVILLSHPNYAPRMLKCYGVTDWRLEIISESKD